MRSGSREIRSRCCCRSIGRSVGLVQAHTSKVPAIRGFGAVRVWESERNAEKKCGSGLCSRSGPRNRKAVDRWEEAGREVDVLKWVASTRPDYLSRLVQGGPFLFRSGSLHGCGDI